MGRATMMSDTVLPDRARAQIGSEPGAAPSASMGYRGLVAEPIIVHPTIEKAFAPLDSTRIH